jgi:hypothetical protein
MFWFFNFVLNCVPEMYVIRNTPITKRKEFSLPVDVICAEYVNGLRQMARVWAEFIQI